MEVSFPESSDTIKASIVIKDATNDLAILKPDDTTKIPPACQQLPFQLTSSSSLNLGSKVSTIGYPLQSILGTNPKFSEGVVSSKTGPQDDPRSLQVSAAIQPGSSGGPLFDADGNVVGVVVAMLDAGKLFAAEGVMPQSVNWAIKSDYLVNLIGMLPNETPGTRGTMFTPDKAAKCVGIVRAQ